MPTSLSLDFTQRISSLFLTCFLSREHDFGLPLSSFCLALEWKNQVFLSQSCFCVALPPKIPLGPHKHSRHEHHLNTNDMMTRSQQQQHLVHLENSKVDLRIWRELAHILRKETTIVPYLASELPVDKNICPFFQPPQSRTSSKKLFSSSQEPVLTFRRVLPWRIPQRVSKFTSYLALLPSQVFAKSERKQHFEKSVVQFDQLPLCGPSSEVFATFFVVKRPRSSFRKVVLDLKKMERRSPSVRLKRRSPFLHVIEKLCVVCANNLEETVALLFAHPQFAEKSLFVKLPLVVNCLNV